MMKICKLLALLFTIGMLAQELFALDPDICVGIDDDVVLPHPDSCEKLIVCENEVPKEGPCPPGMIYDPELSCVFGTCDEEVDPEIPDGEIKCPTGLPPTQLFYVASNTSCDAYYLCLNDQIFEMNCRDGLYWNPEIDKCDFPENVICNINGLSSCNDRNLGYLPYPEDCRFYIFCFNGEQQVQQCPHNQLWDYLLEKCVRSDATCYET